ncbi:hypothetical protein FN976_06740 [Caenimonas sedimenti]|uniref:Uncharacterized protein n=1 Tax=Caenimonas sedimenti TaxID=2596921 RepID=A0A562ZVA1_9BURK|nr:hypothetical protein [Caenimonas sedimenti]TWO72393.1 hypothetical protein FN976_06740 [Caenimonas sedimenti]
MQSAIDSFAPETGPIATRSKWFWVGWGAVAASQLVAFWLLCNNQVKVAEARRADAIVQQLALADCLQYTPRATVASCKVQMQAAQPTTVIVPAVTMPAMPRPVAGAMTVNYTFR